jgi:CheY-like chemotaxis protein
MASIPIPDRHHVEETEPVKELRKRRRVVVVVEDDEFTRSLLSTFLQEEGYRTVSVADGNQALQIIHHVKPDVVTLDLSLPGKGGVEILTQLQQEALPKPIAVIVVSALSSTLPSEVKALASSIVDKPFDLEELSLAIARAINNGHSPIPNSL